MSEPKPKLPAAVPVVGVLVVVGLVAAGWLPRAKRAEAVEAQRQAVLAPRRVITAVAQRAPAEATFSLQGTAAPIRSTVVTSRSIGYVQQVFADLGDPVKSGQLLAVLEAPDVDEDVRRAQARFTEAETNVVLARSSAERAARLSEQGVASKQQAEEAQSRLTTAVASVETARADVSRLAAVRGYSRVVAPFEGIVTRRFVEQGSLAASDRAALFEVSQTKALKVTIDVPQWLASEVRVGTPVKVSAGVRGGVPVDAQVTRTAGALDPSTRSLRTEVLIESAGSVLPNAFVNVSFSVVRASPPVIIPASTVAARAEGQRVYVVNNDVVAVKPVSIARDLGRTVEIASGLEPGQVVVVNPTADLEDNERVQVVRPDGGRP